MTWSGRELQSITKNNNTYSFTYNLDGLRTKKNSNGTNTFYYYDDSNNLIGLKKGNTTVLFYYDSEGKVYSMSKDGNTYFFIKNLQGDVTKIIDEDGTIVATYAYDAWGALLAENEESSVEGLNPFRYRGYVYDSATELYYLQSRYYDPLTGRFINADSPEYTDTYSGSPLSTNMFAYCENNPVMGYDPEGYWDKGDHLSINKQAGFSKITYQASCLADDYFPSDGSYSAPFHSRDGKHSPSSLEIAKNIYNLAIDLSKEYNNGSKSLVKFCYSNEKVKSARKLPIEYYAFLKKSDWTYDTSIKRARRLLNYLNGDKNGDLNKRGYEQLKNRKNQADALLGLALHTLQDHFAHLTKIHVYRSSIFSYSDLGVMTTTYFSNKYLNNTRVFEDEPNVIPWRYTNTKMVTFAIYDLYKSNKKINSLKWYKTRKGKKAYYFTTWLYSYQIVCTEHYIQVKA